jgi:3-carboxy-cis,cis-muconate cycloisomerase
MLTNLQALRAVLPAEAADEWFSPALALHAAEVTRTQLNALNTIQSAERSKTNTKAKT